jgi:hypothetical protein
MLRMLERSVGWKEPRTSSGHEARQGHRYGPRRDGDISRTGPHRRVQAVHERLHQQDAGGVAGRTISFGLGGVPRQGFSQARACRPPRPRSYHRRWHVVRAAGCRSRRTSGSSPGPPRTTRTLGRSRTRRRPPPTWYGRASRIATHRRKRSAAWVARHHLAVFDVPRSDGRPIARRRRSAPDRRLRRPAGTATSRIRWFRGRSEHEQDRPRATSSADLIPPSSGMSACGHRPYRELGPRQPRPGHKRNPGKGGKMCKTFRQPDPPAQPQLVVERRREPDLREPVGGGGGWGVDRSLHRL